MLSVVVPIYNEEENIPAFHSALESVLTQIERVTRETWETVYVNDGSRDSSLSLLMELHARDPRVIVVEFSRNFGHQAALTAGFDHADGDVIICMDADLQHPPELIANLLDAWHDGYDVVHTRKVATPPPGPRRSHG